MGKRVKSKSVYAIVVLSKEEKRERALCQLNGEEYKIVNYMYLRDNGQFGWSKYIGQSKTWKTIKSANEFLEKAISNNLLLSGRCLDHKCDDIETYQDKAFIVMDVTDQWESWIDHQIQKEIQYSKLRIESYEKMRVRY